MPKFPMIRLFATGKRIQTSFAYKVSVKFSRSLHPTIFLLKLFSFIGSQICLSFEIRMLYDQKLLQNITEMMTMMKTMIMTTTITMMIMVMMIMPPIIQFPATFLYFLNIFLVACTRLYKPLCWLVGWSLGLLVRR